MKKFYFCLAALAIAAIGCNKVEEEVVNNTPAEQPQKENVVYLSANLPEFVDTKATISEAGTFAWVDGDVISVLCKKEGESELHYVDFTYDASAGKFACDLTNAYYLKNTSSGVEPVFGTFTVATATEIASQTLPFAKYPAQMVAVSNVNYDAIGKLFKMEGSLATDGSINFVHKSSLLKLDYENVPGIAKTVKVVNGSEAVIAKLNGATGNVSMMIPVTPTGSSQTIRFELCMQDGTLLVLKKKTADIAAGKLYKAPKITINPDVYLISDLTNWDYTKALKMSGASSTKTATLVGNVDKYYRYVVDYGENHIDMGPVTDGSTSMDETFTTVASASKLSDYGTYYFSFDFVTAKNKVTSSSTAPKIYLTGSFQTSPWSLNNDTEMIMPNKKEGYLAMNVAANTEFKAYTNPFWGSSFPSGDNVKLEAANYYLMVADAAAGTLQGIYAGATSSTATSMTLKGSFDSWGTGLAMTQLGSSPFWYVNVDWASQTEFRFVNGSNWMSEASGSYATPTASQDENGYNIRVVAGKYRIIASESNGRFAIVAR